MNNHLMDFLVATGVALVFLLLGWAETRGIFLGKPLPSDMRRMIAYGFFFVLGTAYIMMVVSWLDGPPRWIFALVTAWGALLVYIAWWRYQRTRGPSPAPRKSISTVLAERLLVLGLLAFLIASLIGWSVWGEGETHLWVPLLWTVGAAGMIFLARRNRRTTLVAALRGLGVLAAIGVIGRPSWAAVMIVAVIAGILILLEKLWKEPGASDEQGSHTLFPKPNHPPSSTRLE